MADELSDWTLISEGGEVVAQVGQSTKDHAETVKVQLEGAGRGPLKIRKGRKHQVGGGTEQEEESG